MVWIVCLGLLGAVLAAAVAGAHKWWVLAQAGVAPSTLPPWQLAIDVMGLHWMALAGALAGIGLGAVLAGLTRGRPAPPPPPVEQDTQYLHFRGEADDNIRTRLRRRAVRWTAERAGRKRRVGERH